MEDCRPVLSLVGSWHWFVVIAGGSSLTWKADSVPLNSRCWQNISQEITSYDCVSLSFTNFEQFGCD